MIKAHVWFPSPVSRNVPVWIDSTPEFFEQRKYTSMNIQRESDMKRERYTPTHTSHINTRTNTHVDTDTDIDTDTDTGTAANTETDTDTVTGK